VALHPAIQAELEALQLQYGKRAMLSLDDYAEMYGIDRHNASRHLRRRMIPFSKEGNSLYISIIDLATYKAKCKMVGERTETQSRAKSSRGTFVEPVVTVVHRDLQEEMRQRRGFSKLNKKRKEG